MGIASFFKPKPAAAAAKDVEMTDETSRDSASAPADTPTKEVEKVSPTPDTQKVGRKRIKRVESSDEEDNAPEEPPSKKDPARAASPAAEPSASESSAAPEKSPAKSPVKSQGASSKSVASFFTKKPEAESPAANKASEEKTDKTAAAKEAKKEVAAEPHAHSSPAKAQTPAKPAASFFGAAAPKTSSKSPAKEAKVEVKAVTKEVVKKEVAKGGKAEEKTEKKEKGEDDEEEEEDEDEMDAADEVAKGAGWFEAEKEATWKKGQPVPYAHLAAAFEAIEATTKRLEIAAILTKCFRTIIEMTPEDLLPAVYLACNKLAPPHEGIELGLGEMVITKALAEATGKLPREIKSDYEKLGDLGLVAMKSRSSQRTMFAAKALTLSQVHKVLLQIAHMSGNKSGDQKKDKIKGLLVASKGQEAQYIVRHLQGKLRIGLAEQSVLVALAHAVCLSPPVGKAPSGGPVAQKEAMDKAVEMMKEVHSQLPCYDKIIPQLMKAPIAELGAACFLTPGVPIKPMLAHPTKGISEVLDRFANQEFTCEYKYDGERGQFHMLPDGTMKIFSRNSEDNTTKYPDVINIIPQVISEDVKSFVMDCEVVAYDRETKRILPFQVLSTRKRKDVDETQVTVQVCLYAFDLLFLNGESLLKAPLSRRRTLLKDSFREVEGTFGFATHKDCSDTEEILAFLNEAVNASCEGLMVKTLDASNATYEPDKRSHKWLKVKKDYISGMTDSLDLVPIGAFYGKGKRTGVYGAYLLACYNEETEEYETICKIGTGFSDVQLKEFHALFAPEALDAPKSYYQYEPVPKDTPDVWFEPKVVWEVAAADLSISPVHKAGIGLVDDAKGIALRFPRLVRVRNDKNPENATNSTQVAEMYRNQAVCAD